MSKQAKFTQKRNKKDFKKVLTKQVEDDRMNELSNLRHSTEKEIKKDFKKSVDKQLKK